MDHVESSQKQRDRNYDATLFICYISSARHAPGRKFRKKGKTVGRRWSIGKFLRCRSNKVLNQRMSTWLLRCQWNDMKESAHSWLNESMNQWIYKWIKHWINQWINEPMNQRSNEAMKQWADEPVNQWIINQWINGSVNQWINESMKQWISEPTIESMNQWEWIIEAMNQWIIN